MEYIILDLDESTEDEIKAAIDYNGRTAKIMRTETDKLKKVAQAAKKATTKIIQEPRIEPDQNQPEQIDEDFEHELEYYFSLLKDVKSENIEEEIIQALPSRKHYQYERILTRLKLESLRALKEIKELLFEEGLELSDIEELEKEYEFELKKIDLLTKLLEPQKEEKVEIRHENNLIFVPTAGGDIRVLDEIDNIPYEYYERFQGLFQSIKDGTFKNVQRFASNSELSGLCEVKDFKVRVLFVRLSNDSYAVISAFIKKSDNDKGYRTSVIRKYSDFQLIENNLQNNLKNEEFMSLQKSYEQELFRKLSPSVKQSSVVKKKAGDK